MIVASSKEATRLAIIDAAQRLFDRFGPIKTSVADIARELGMSPANIYNFFPSRDAIMEAVGKIHLAALTQEVSGEIARTDDPWQRIRLLFLITARHLRSGLRNEKHILQLQALHGCREMEFVTELDRFLHRELEAILREGVERGCFRPMDPAATAGCLFDCMVGALDPVIVARFANAEYEPRLVAQLDLLEQAVRCRPAAASPL